MCIRDSRGGSPFGGGTKSDEPPKPIVELPNYELNQIRRRIKVLTFSVQDVLINEKSSLGKSVPTKHADFLKKVGLSLGDVMKNSSLGIKDMDMRKKKDAKAEEPQTVSFAMQLKQVCETAVEELDKELRIVRGENVDPAPGEEVDAEGNASPFSGG